MKNIFTLEGAREIPQAVKAAGFASMTRVFQPVCTRRLGPDQEEAAFPEIFFPKADSLAIFWHGMTDTGKVRPHNEDNFACQDYGSRSLFVVADGMGGHDAGEVASKIAVKTVCKELGRHATHNDDPQGLVALAARLANVDVKKEGALRGSDMGTTLSLLLCTDGLWGELSDEAIHGICSTEKDSEKICARLLRMANEKGGKDNMTAVVVKIS